MPKLRLDQLLVARGLCESREKAQRAILAGEVSTSDGRRLEKPGTQVRSDIPLELAQPPRYVGRGGLKMEGALTHFAMNPTGWTCLDIGASTGGFTDCLLQHGAEKVWAIDVGHSQLDWKIRSDPRVIVREKLNARYLTREDIPDPIRLCVIDVSFISLTLILPPAAALLTPDGMIVALIKPQFELEREAVNRGGVVKDPAEHERAIRKVETFVTEKMERTIVGTVPSPILGTDGNREFLTCIR